MLVTMPSGEELTLPPPAIMADPTPEELAAYRAGALSIERFGAIDAWIAAQPSADQERLLAGDDRADPALLPPESAAGPDFRPEDTRGRYIRRERIGAGGMGLVDLMHDRALERDVALKRCRPRDPAESPASHALRLRLFRREAVITARLEHPNIIPIHDVGSGAGGEPAYLMKRLGGATLADRAPLSPAEAANLLLAVADAVGFAHRRGIVHRDLKPEHLRLGDDGEILVIDWGLAGAIGSGIDACGELGTPPWRAPEQTASAPADPRMDVWALGGLLLFALTGREPGAAEPPSRGLGAIARHCLQADPAARYPDGAAVAADLRRWLRDGIAAAERPSPVLRAGRFLRRHPALLLAVGGAILAGSVIAGQRHRATVMARDFLETPLPSGALLDRWQADLAELPATSTVQRALTRIADARQSEVIQAAARR